MSIALRVDEEGPELLDKERRLFLEEACEVELQLLGIRVIRSFEKVDNQIYDDVVLETEEVRDALRYPGIHHGQLHLARSDLHVTYGGHLEALLQLSIHTDATRLLERRAAKEIVGHI